ncbi:hypothetical protein Tco_0132625 [Tanacetum coccineum]
MKTLDALLSLLTKVTEALDRFAQALESASHKAGDQSVSSAGQAGTHPIENLWVLQLRRRSHYQSILKQTTQYSILIPLAISLRANLTSSSVPSVKLWSSAARINQFLFIWSLYITPLRFEYAMYVVLYMRFDLNVSGLARLSFFWRSHGKSPSLNFLVTIMILFTESRPSFDEDHVGSKPVDTLQVWDPSVTYPKVEYRLFKSPPFRYSRSLLRKKS